MKKIFLIKSLLYTLFFALLFVSCKKESQNSTGNTSSTSSSSGDSSGDSIKVSEEKVEESAPPEVQENGFYNPFVVPKDKKLRDSMYAVFSKKYDEKSRYAILALNRLDSRNKWNSDTLVVPKEIDTTLMSYSPFPKQLEVLAEVKKFVVFSYPIQAYGVYSNGALVKWGPTSMGKKAAQTTRGLTFVNWKKELAISTVKSEWKLPFNVNIHNFGGIGWHQYDLPGYPASHSCLRLLMNDAKWMYRYIDTWVLNKGGATTQARGTAVIVFGDYKWGKRKPWRNLLSDPNANNISVDEMNKLIEPNIKKILAEQANREKVVDSLQSAKALVNTAPVEESNSAEEISN